MKRVAIIGGGVSGLTAAYGLRKLRDAQVTLFEAGARVGGVIRTEQVNGFLVEGGPDSFLTMKPAAEELARDLGLERDLIHSQDELRQTHIVVDGKLRALPSGFQMMVPSKPWTLFTSRLFSIPAVLRFFEEPLIPPDPLPKGEDESVASFVTRHFGAEVSAKAAAPLIAGVYGGSAEKLSARAVLPQFIEMERKHKSLVRALMSRKKSTPQPLFTSFRWGMQQLTDALARRIGPNVIRLNTPVNNLQRAGAKWNVNGEEFDAVVLAVPAYAAAKLLGEVSKELANELATIEYSSATVIALGYKESPEDMKLPLGFGFLVPREENMAMFACTFVHNKLPYRAPAGKSLLRVFIGGEFREEQLGRVIGELYRVAKVNVQPEFVRVYTWPKAMPQYAVGHLERVDRIETLAAKVSGLALAGNVLHGIGIPDCITSARKAARLVGVP